MAEHSLNVVQWNITLASLYWTPVKTQKCVSHRLVDSVCSFHKSVGVIAPIAHTCGSSPGTYSPSYLNGQLATLQRVCPHLNTAAQKLICSTHNRMNTQQLTAQCHYFIHSQWLKQLWFTVVSCEIYSQPLLDNQLHDDVMQCNKLLA